MPFIIELEKSQSWKRASSLQSVPSTVETPLKPVMCVSSVILHCYAVYITYLLIIIRCVQYAIDEIKASVPIWKKEFYEDGSSWKENQEFRDRHQC